MVRASERARGGGKRSIRLVSTHPCGSGEGGDRVHGGSETGAEHRSGRRLFSASVRLRGALTMRNCRIFCRFVVDYVDTGALTLCCPIAVPSSAP